MNKQSSATRAMAGALGVIALLSLASCGGDDAGPAAEKTSESVDSRSSATTRAETSSDASTASSPRSSAATTQAEPITVTLGKTGWYGGFAVTLDELTAEPGPFGTSATINATYQNLADEAQVPPQGAVVLDGASLPTQWDSPNIPGAGKAKGTIAFDIEADDDKPVDEAALTALLAKATLTYGEAADNQTKLPLAANGKVESTEPKELTSAGTLTQGQLIVDVLDGHLQPSYASGEKGKAELSLHIKISCAADCPASGFNVDASMFSVKGPDGTSVVADSRSEYCCDTIYPGDVSDNAKNIVTFVVPVPGTGPYTLTFNNPTLTSGGIAAATFAFTA